MIKFSPKVVERTILQGIAYGESERRSLIWFPKIRSLREIFTACHKVEDLGKYKSTNVHTWKFPSGLKDRITSEAHLSSFVSIQARNRSRPCLDVQVQPEIIQWIPQHMMLSDQYVLNFQIVERCDGTALVTLHYNQISGSRWIALIPASELDGRRLRFGPKEMSETTSTFA